MPRMSDPHPRCTSLHILQAEKDEIGARAIIGEVTKLLGGEGHANARRIVAAVNACRGIPTEALEHGVVAQLHGALDYLLEQTVDQDLKYGIGLSEGEEDARAKALAAIAKARGEEVELAA